MKKIVLVVSLAAIAMFGCKKKDGEQFSPNVSNGSSISKVDIKSDSVDLLLYPNAYFDNETKSFVKNESVDKNLRIEGGLCSFKNSIVKNICYGHRWHFYYYINDTDSAFVIPTLIGGTDPITGVLLPNTALWASDGSVKEYTYLQNYLTDEPFNSGTLIVDSCGKGFLITTQILNNPSQWFTFSSIRWVWNGTNLTYKFKGKAPEGVGAPAGRTNPFRVRIEGIRQN